MLWPHDLYALFADSSAAFSSSGVASGTLKILNIRYRGAFCVGKRRFLYNCTRSIGLLVSNIFMAYLK